MILSEQQYQLRHVLLKIVAYLVAGVSSHRACFGAGHESRARSLMIPSPKPILDLMACFLFVFLQQLA